MAKKSTPQAPVAPSLGTDSAPPPDLPPPVAPPLDTGSGEPIAARVDPLDHDGDGAKGGAVPLGATQSYEDLMAENAQLKHDLYDMQMQLEAETQLCTHLKAQLASAREPGDQTLADAVADKVVQRLGGGDMNASGAPNRPPEHIDQLRTPGINS